MTFVIDRKTERINNKSTLNQRNFMLKSIKTKYFLKTRQNMCYFILEKNSKYIHKELKEYDETSDACEFLKKFKNTSEVHKSCEKVKNINEIQSLECNEYY